LNKWQEMYKQKLTTAEEAAKYVQEGDICASACGVGEPPALADAIAERAKREGIRGISHELMLTLHHLKCQTPEYAPEYMRHVAWFIGGPGRKAIQTGLGDFMPAHYKDVPYWWRNYRKADIHYATVSPMDKHGFFSYGPAAGEGRAQLERARVVLLEVNENMPRCHGPQFVHISEVTALIENNVPLPSLPDVPLTEEEIAIGNYIGSQISNGATIQLGIGGMPNAVAAAIMDKRNIGFHSEMFPERAMDLMEAGVIDNTCKPIHKNVSVGSFTVGSTKLYDFIDDNPSVEFHSIDYTNNFNIIASHDNFVSINATLEVSLIGEACSETIGPMPFSGTGGQSDFAKGALGSKGGKAFLSMNSTAKKGTVSKVVPMLTHGANVTVSKNDIDHVVTEYGIAKLRGKTASERAKEMISVAHPKFREELTYAAKKMLLIP